MGRVILGALVFVEIREYVCMLDMDMTKFVNWDDLSFLSCERIYDPSGDGCISMPAWRNRLVMVFVALRKSFPAWSDACKAVWRYPVGCEGLWGLRYGRGRMSRD